jgi:hypothetical protein
LGRRKLVRARQCERLMGLPLRAVVPSWKLK